MDYKKLYSDLIVELFIFLDNDSHIKIRDFIIKQGEQESNKQTKMKKTRHEDFVWNVKESDGIIKPLGGILIEMVKVHDTPKGRYYSAVVNGFLMQYETDGRINNHLSREEWKKLALSTFEND